MEQVCKRQKRDSDEAKLEDLPEEIILKILSSVNIRDLFQCMAVNKKFREIANDQTLWNIMHIDGDDYGNWLPAELLSQIIAKGCQYLSLFKCKIVKKGTIEFVKQFQLKYLCVDAASEEVNENGKEVSFNILPDFAASCYNLEKLSIKRRSIHLHPEISRIELKFFKCIIQNSDTLKVLDLSEIDFNLASVQRIFLLCQQLLELNIPAHHCISRNPQLCSGSVDFICNNLATTIEKLDITGQVNFGDDQFKTLLKRCNRITELSLSGTSVTDESVNTIIETLSQSLVKLEPGYISFPKKLELASMPKFKVLINSRLSDEEREEVREILPNMKHEDFDGDLRIAEPYPDLDSDDEESEMVPNGFWEIKAKLRTYN